MFEAIRKHMKLLMGFLMLLIIPSFVLFGIEGYGQFNAKGEVVAQVAGQDITQEEWDAAHRQETDRLMASMPGLNRAMLDTEQTRYATLERLVNDRVLAVAAQKFHFAVSDQRLARELSRNETIASLRKPDGSLDMERYRQLLSTQGMTPEMFENGVRADLARNQVTQGLLVSGFVPSAAAQATANAFFERREVQVLRFVAADFKSKVSVSDADIQSYYDANPGQFQAPERVDVEYLLLDLESIARNLSISEADLRAYYDQNASRLAGPETRRASHILLTVPAGASAEQKAAVKAKAQGLLDQAKANPGRFAELAKANSQDPGSAVNGGDLDYFGRGAMVKPFEDAAFALQKDQVSDLVETEFGFHIIRVTDIKAPPARTFEQVRPEIEAELRKQKATQEYAAAAETFSNTVYEQADSLAPTAEKLKLTVRTAQGLTRQPPADAASASPVQSPKVLEALFNPDAIQSKRNSEAIEIGSNRLLSARVVKHTPAQTRPLTEVSAALRERLLNERALAQAKSAGETQLAGLQAAPGTSVKWLAAVTISRDQPQGLPPALIRAALAADTQKSLPVHVGVDLAEAGYALVRVNQVVQRPAPSAENAQQERAQLAQLWSAAENAAYVEVLKARFKAQIRVKKPGAAEPAKQG